MKPFIYDHFKGLLLIWLLLFSNFLWSQNLTITGQVTSEDGEALIGVTIAPEGKTGGTVTDIDGNFELQAAINDVLIFNYVGYAEQRITLKDAQALQVQMQTEAEVLDEVIVVGYGTTRKSDLTGSVASVKSEELAKTTITSLEQGLQGRIAGVHVTQGDAAPGAGISIEIRGTNSILGGNEPLYVIDGIPVTNPAARQGALGASEPNNRIVSNTNILATLSPSDIASIEILKDASATAIYGSRGANGVVMITTKKGKSGKGQVTFNAFLWQFRGD